jgi:hypothetical protein
VSASILIVELGRSTFGAGLGTLVQFLRRNVRTVRPGDRPAVEEESLKVLHVLQRLKDRPLQVASEVDRFLRIVIESHTNPVAPRYSLLCTHGILFTMPPLYRNG